MLFIDPSVCFFFSCRHSPLVGLGLLIHEVCFSRSHTTHHSRQDSSGRVISSSQRPLPDSTQHSQQTNIHAPNGIRTQDLSRRAAVDLRLRPRGRWDRPICMLTFLNMWLELKFGKGEDGTRSQNAAVSVFTPLRMASFSPKIVSTRVIVGVSN